MGPGSSGVMRGLSGPHVASWPELPEPAHNAVTTWGKVQTAGELLLPSGGYYQGNLCYVKQWVTIPVGQSHELTTR